MAPFEVTPLSREEVQRQLAAAHMAQSRALAGTTVYNLSSGDGDWLLVALPGGEGLRIEAVKPPPRRRRADAGKPSPTSR